jgi:hypothetical protein
LLLNCFIAGHLKGRSNYDKRQQTKKLFELEEEMAKHKATMQNCVVKKQEILDKYLK